MKRKIAVIGGGNGGQAIAAHSALLGYEVIIFDTNFSIIKELQKGKKIILKGDETGSTKNFNCTYNMEEAVKSAEIIMIVTPATSHAKIAKDIASFLTDGQIIVLNPGYFLGALDFSHILRREGCDKEVIVGDTESLIYACRAEKPGRVEIYRVKRTLLAGAFPGNQTHFLVKRLSKVYPQIKAARNILETTFGNVNLVLHVPIALLNVGRIESKQEFMFYYDGASQSIMNLEEKLDNERLAVASQFGIKAKSIRDLLADFYNITGKSLYNVVRKNPAYAHVKAPSSLNTRLITEDVPMGLVPIASAAEQFQVKVPIHQNLIELASLLMNDDYVGKGRTMESLGLSEMNAKGIVRYLERGST